MSFNCMKVTAWLSCLQSLGQVGRVLKVKANGDVRVAVNGERWIYNPQCLVSAPGEVPMEEHTGQIFINKQYFGPSTLYCSSNLLQSFHGSNMK